jgi:hypothetical protein
MMVVVLHRLPPKGIVSGVEHRLRNYWKMTVVLVYIGMVKPTWINDVGVAARLG